MNNFKGKIGLKRIFSSILALSMVMASVPALPVRGADIVYVKNGSELDSAIKNAATGTVIMLENDIDAISSSTYSVSKTFTIDGNGYTINGNDLSKTALRFSSSSANVTLQNANIINMSSSLKYGGGAVGVYKGKLNINNCTFVGNTNTSSDAKEANGGGAVVAHSSSATLTVTNSTFYGNTTNGAGGAILSKEGSTTITNVTVVGNKSGYSGGGISGYKGSKTNITNSIVVGNYKSSASNDVYYATDGGSNLFGTVSSLSSSKNTTGYTVATAGLEAGEPQDNDTLTGLLTIALLEASPAINGAIESKAPEFDERGYEREDEPDIGAYEYVDDSGVSKPRVTPKAGTYTEYQEVELTSKTDGADIYYTTDGSDPSVTNGTKYTGTPVLLSDEREITLKAVAYLDGEYSKILEAKYGFKTATPGVSLAAGTYYDVLEVALTGEDNAEIYYTTNGTTPTAESTRYTQPITVDKNMTIKAIAYKDVRESDVLSASYTVYLPQTVHVSTGAELHQAISNADYNAMTNIYLDNDIDAVTSATYSQGVKITIHGQGHTIDGKGVSKSALSFKSSNDDITIKDVTMQNMTTSLKYGGGAIGVYKGDLVIENATFLNNYTTNSSAGGGAVLAHSSSSSLLVKNSTFYGNSSAEGGAIFAKGPGEIINCTIIGNTASGKGGGLRNDSSSSSTQAWVYNSIIVGNKGSSGKDIYRATDGGYNLIGDIYGINSAKDTTIYDSTMTAESIGLEEGAPQDNDTEIGTYTIAIIDDASPAINAANEEKAPLTDQRGYDRYDEPDIGAYEYVDFGSVKKPTVTPKAGVYNDFMEVELVNKTEGAQIYYTLDGNEPTKASTKYTEGTKIALNESLILRAIAYVGEEFSGIMEAKYVFITDTPAASPKGGTYLDAQYVTLSAAEGAHIFYTLDGTTPDKGSILFDDPIRIDENLTLKAIAYTDDGRESVVMSESYTIYLPQTKYVSTGDELNKAIKEASAYAMTTIVLENDIDAVTSATYGNGVNITIEGQGYTIDGKSKTNTALRFKSSNDDVILKNVTMQNMNSNIKYGGGAVGVYKGDLTIDNSVFLNNTATYSSSSGGGAVLAHSSGSVLKISNSTFYGNKSYEGGAITAKGYGEIINCTIVGNTATSKGGGIRNESSTVSNQTVLYNNIIVGNTAPSGADVYRANDGGNNLVGTVYTLSNTKATTQTGMTVDSVKLVPGAPKLNDAMNGLYTIALLEESPAINSANGDKAPATDGRGYERDDEPDIGAYEYLSVVRKPVVTPEGGLYSKAQTVTITCPTEGAEIYYTLDGSMPAKASGLKYTAPITIDESATLKVIAFAGEDESILVEEEYLIVDTVTGATPKADPAGGYYNTTQTVTLTAEYNDAEIYYTLDGSDPTTSSTKYIGPVSISQDTTLKARAVINGVIGGVMEEIYIMGNSKTVYVTNGTELASAIKGAASGAEIVLTNDIDAVSGATYSSKTLTINGNGYTIDGSKASNTALKFAGTNNITLKNLTMQNMQGQLKYGGGALGVYKGTVNIENCAFINNTATSGDGGAVLLDSSSGGGITIKNSTFYGNTAKSYGGAIASAGSGEVINSTIVNNSASNGGGVYANNSNSVRVYNSILANNSASNNKDFYNAVNSGNNIVESSHPDWLDTAIQVNKQGTPTMALLEGSPAIDTADASKAPATDQRGILRDALPDIGAFEYYEIDEIAVEKPKAEPKGGSYLAAQQVTLTTETEDAEIYYTLDGTTPSAGSIKYTGAIDITADTTLKAIAVKEDTESLVTTEFYTIGTTIVTYKSLEDAEITFVESEFVYARGEAVEPEVIVILEGDIVDTDAYEVGYKHNVNAGTAVVIVTAAEGSIYTDSASQTFTIDRAEVAEADFNFIGTDGEIYETFAEFSAESKAIYNNSPIPAIIAPAKGVSGMGDIYVLYDGEDDAPVNPGSYQVMIEVGLGYNYNASSAPISLGAYVIEKLPVSVPEQILTVRANEDRIYRFELGNLIAENMDIEAFQIIGGQYSELFAESAAIEGTQLVIHIKDNSEQEAETAEISLDLADVEVPADEETANEVDLDIEPAVTEEPDKSEVSDEFEVPEQVEPEDETVSEEPEADEGDSKDDVTKEETGDINYTRSTGKIGLFSTSHVIEIDVISDYYDFEPIKIIIDTTTEKYPVYISGVKMDNKVYDGEAVSKPEDIEFKLYDGSTRITAVDTAFIWSGGDAPVDAGTYTLTVQGTNYADIYAIDEKTVSFVIHKADQTASFEQVRIESVGQMQRLTTYSDSGLEVDLISSDEDVAVIEDGVLYLVGEGIVTITALQAGNQNYNPAQAYRYTFYVNGDSVPPVNTKLAILDVNTGELTPEFNPNIKEYEVTVGEDESIIFITAGAEDTNAKVTGAGHTYLSYGENIIEIIVTGVDNLTQETYTITIYREEPIVEASAKLASLSVDRGVLSPVFHRGTFEYEVTVEEDVDSITVTAEAEDADAIVTGAGVTALVYGENVIEITVTGSDGATEEVYTVKVTREEPEEEDNKDKDKDKNSSGTSSDNGREASYIPSGSTTHTSGGEGKDDEVNQEAEFQSVAFADVDENAWYIEGVEFVLTNNLFSGLSANQFGPGKEMTRAMLVTVLYRLDGAPTVNGSNFADVDGGMWYTDGVNWAASNGIVSGIGNGLFAPDNNITREQMALILYNYAEFKGIKLEPVRGAMEFTDGQDMSDWAKDAVSVMVQAGILSGKENNKFDPKGTATRAETAVMLKNFIEAI